MNNSTKSATLKMLDSSLQWFLDDRLDLLEQASRERAVIQNISPSMEAMLKAELYGNYKDLFGDGNVFLEWPGVGREKFDIFINNIRKNQSAYLEFKMYYRKAEDEYEKDIRKLKEIIDMGNNSIAILVHFELYLNPKKPNHILIDSFKSKMSSKYYSEISTIQTKCSEKHFYRLAFWKK